jgi:hypothetical protein
MKFAAGDYFTNNPERIYRVRRVKGKTIWYLSNQYGEYSPKGILQKSYGGQSDSWIKVEKNYNI